MTMRWAQFTGVDKNKNDRCWVRFGEMSFFSRTFKIDHLVKGNNWSQYRQTTFHILSVRRARINALSSKRIQIRGSSFNYIATGRIQVPAKHIALCICRSKRGCVMLDRCTAWWLVEQFAKASRYSKHAENACICINPSQCFEKRLLALTEQYSQNDVKAAFATR